jgi:hypothetical protein
MMRFTLPFVLATAAASPALAAVKEYWWNITYVLDTIPDGLAARRAVGVNGTWPYVHVLSLANTRQLLTRVFQSASDRYQRG